MAEPTLAYKFTRTCERMYSFSTADPCGAPAIVYSPALGYLCNNCGMVSLIAGFTDLTPLPDQPESLAAMRDA